MNKYSNTCIIIYNIILNNILKLLKYLNAETLSLSYSVEIILT